MRATGLVTAPEVTIVLIFDLELTISACLQSRTRVVVAWCVHYEGPPIQNLDGALVLTPGGGRSGRLLSGVLDNQILEAARTLEHGVKMPTLFVTTTDALIAGVEPGGRATCIIADAAVLPEGFLGALHDRTPIGISFRKLPNQDFAIELLNVRQSSSSSIQELVDSGVSGSIIADDTVISVWAPRTHLVIAGVGRIAEALAEVAVTLRWNVTLQSSPDVATGLIGSLSSIDAVIVAHHDVEAAGRCLDSALKSRAGYIGSVGSDRMQQARADWLGYRGHSNITRIHGPAGIRIHARKPWEVAVSVLAEAIHILNTARLDEQREPGRSTSNIQEDGSRGTQ